jgi:uncharacterized membrane protein YkgB
MATATEHRQAGASGTLLRIGEFLLRYGLVVILGWIGLLKFASYEANAIQKFVENSPLTSWMYAFLSVQTAAIVIGLWEATAAALIALRPVSAKISAVGSAMAVVVFLMTLSFLFTTPGIWHKGMGFPFLSGAPGGFLLKDLVLLAAAVWTLGEALRDA